MNKLIGLTRFSINKRYTSQWSITKLFNNNLDNDKEYWDKTGDSDDSDLWSSLINNSRDRKVNVNWNEIQELENNFKKYIVDVEKLRSERKKIAKNKNDQSRGLEIKKELIALESKGNDLRTRLSKEVNRLPNWTSSHTPIGDESASKIISMGGNKKEFKTLPQDHLSISNTLGLFDFASASKATGSKFYYSMGMGALLEMALSNWSFNFAISKGWYPVLAPELVQKEMMEACGFHPRSELVESLDNIEEDHFSYSLTGKNLVLSATAEIPLAAMFSDKLYKQNENPTKKLVSYGSAFRPEAGAGGKESKGLYRVHQFKKVELFSICEPHESEEIHKDILNLQMEIFDALELHYRVLEMSSEELGASAFRKFDIEAWMPGKAIDYYGEVSSASNCTNYQTKRLDIRKKDSKGKNYHLHSVNGTACAVSRTLVSLIEQHQQPNGSIYIPKVLRPYLNNLEYIESNKVL